MAEPLDAIERIKKRGQLIVAIVKADEPPFFMRDQKGQTIGVDPRLARLLANELGVRLKILRTANTYDEVIDQVERGEADLGISALSITLKRAQKVNYSEQYISIKKSILLNYKIFSEFKKSDKESLLTFFEAGHKIGVVRGTAYVHFAHDEFPNAQIISYDDWDSLLKGLSREEIAAGFSDQFSVEQVIFSHHYNPFLYQAIDLNVPTDKVAIAIPKADLNLLNWINTFLKIRFKHLTVKDLLLLYNDYETKKAQA